MKIPHTRPGAWPGEIPPSRFAAGVRTDSPAGCRVALLGLPDDLGVRLNKGRPGAAQGPAALRSALAKYGVGHPDGFSWPAVFDAGDVTPAQGDGAEALHETHRRVTEAAAAIMAAGLFPVAIGGGHDLTFAFVRGALAGSKFPGGVYADAHLDVRAEPGSGMPFRSLIMEAGVKRLVAVGINPLANTHEHTAYFRTHGGVIAKDLSMASQTLAACDALFASVDLDAIDQSCAPGVSAPSPAGLSVAQAEAFVHDIAIHPRLRCFDIMELNPAHDEGGRTARLAAHLLLTFLRVWHARTLG